MDKPRYIRIAAIQSRLRTAERERVPIYVHAPTGTGKTAAVNFYYRNEKVCMLSGIKGFLDQMLPVGSIEEDTIVIDDMSFIVDTQSQDYVRGLIRSGEKHLVMLGRCVMPHYLLAENMAGLFLTCDEATMSLDEAAIGRLAAEMGVPTDARDQSYVYTQVAHDTAGYFPYIHTVLSLMAGGRKYDKGLGEEAFAMCCRYLDQTFSSQWRGDLMNLLLSVADFDVFTPELARCLSLEPRVEPIFEYAMTIGDFLRVDSDGSYRMRRFLQRYLLWKRKIAWDCDRQNDVYRRACEYFRIHERFDMALKFASLMDNTNEVRNLLTMQAQRNPSTAQYLGSRTYYAQLTDEDILGSPALMEGRAMLESLTLHPEQSDRWYSELEEYGKNPSLTKQEKRDVKQKLAYLSIALPHRDPAGIQDMIRHAAALLSARTISDMQEFSVTSMMPSLMNGGKDFSEWSKKDRELAKTMRLPVEMVLGRSSVGLVDIALAESAFEKNDRDPYEVMSLLQMGIGKARRAGNSDMAFAGTGVSVKLHASHGHSNLALRLLNDFESDCRQAGIDRFDQNIQAMKAWLSLLEGDLTEARIWLESAPNENTDFNVFDRFRYMVKLRTLIALENYEEAWGLSVRLEGYFRVYHRAYYGMENTVLQAIILNRVGNDQWRDLLESVVAQAFEYHFVWVIAREGNAVLPLLKQVKGQGSEAFFEEVLTMAGRMADFYPEYLKRLSILSEPLTAAEERILLLHVQGASTREICDKLGITENTLKYHNKNIYRKLGVRNKAEAVRKARGASAYGTQHVSYSEREEYL